MTDLAPKLQNQLEQVLRLVDDPHFRALNDGEGLRKQAVALAQRLAQAESEPLTIGLLGGTGVGKSTTLNALAGSEISAASHRRPRTDQILIYRHEEAKALLLDRLNDIPWQEFTHRNPSVGKIVLCDLPDFDSIKSVHRERVVGFLDHLDLLIWVTSPEKYADQQFHDFLAGVPKSQRNFYFVLNKLDILFTRGASEKGYEDATTVSQAFQQRLRDNGVVEPLIFLVSAKAALDGDPPAPWNQFPTLKNQVFQERRLKEIMTIKATNLDVEVQALLGRVREGIQSLETFDGVLLRTLEHAQSQRTAWLDEWEGAIEGWADNHLRDRLREQRPDPVPLLGPGYGVSVIMDRIKKGTAGAERVLLEQNTGFSPDAVFATFERQLESVATRIEAECLRHSLPESFKDRAGNMLCGPRRLESLRSAVSHIQTWHVSKAPWPPFWGFKMWQGACYSLVLVIFLLAIGGEIAWGNVFDNVGFNTLGRLVLSIIHTLFSSKGLAAFGSYILLNLFLGLRFYRRFSSLAKRVADKRVAQLRKGLVGAWEKEMDTLYDSFEKTHQEIQKEKATITDVAGTHHH